MALDDEAFWAEQHSRDLLHVLKTRWLEFSDTERGAIIERLLQGRQTRYPYEEEDRYLQRRAFDSLNRIYWLRDEGCELGINIEETTRELRVAAPNWRPEYAAGAVTGLESRVGWVRTDTAYSELESEDDANLIEKAITLSGRTDDFLVERDPLLGLSRDQPERTLRALSISKAPIESLANAWSTFLRHDVRSEHAASVTEATSLELLNSGDDLFSRLTRSVVNWLEFASGRDGNRKPIDRDLIVALLDRCAASLEENPQPSGLVRSSNAAPDWVTEAINAPAGSLADALFNDPQLPSPADRSGLPPEWCRRAERLLMLPDDQRHYALVLLARRIHYLFAQDEGWTERRILVNLDVENLRETVLQGILGSGLVPAEKLFRRIKDRLIERAFDASDDRDRYDEALAAFLLSGWAFDSDDPLISDEDFRTVILRSGENFRARILWQAWMWVRPNLRSDSGDVEIGDVLRGRLLRLFREVWPKQRAAQSGSTARRMVDVAFESGDMFPDISEAIKPFLVPHEEYYHLPPEVRRSDNSLIERYPEITLDLISRVLPNDKRKWPYGLDGILDRIARAVPELANDSRFIMIRRGLER